MLRFLFSTRAVVLVTGVLAYIVSMRGTERIFGEAIDFQNVLIGILVLTALSIAASAFTSFDVESKREFIADIGIDVLLLCASVALLSFLLTRQMAFQNIEAEAIVLAGTALGLSALDFLISLNAGAGKLLEMDREHISKGGN